VGGEIPPPARAIAALSQVRRATLIMPLRAKTVFEIAHEKTFYSADLPLQTGLDGSWANLLPCYSNDSAPSYNPDWWCGLDTACDLDVANAEPTRNYIFTLPFTGKAATIILANGTTSPGCASSGESTTATASASVTTVTVTPSASSDALCRLPSNVMPSGAIAGLAILGVVALLSIGWALYENRTRRRQGKLVSRGGFGQASQIPPDATHGDGRYGYKHEVEGRMLPAEMDARNKHVIAEM
jgi:hypothetical protein